MAAPVNARFAGSGIDQLKAQIVSWIRQEIRDSKRNGIGLPVDGRIGTLSNDGLTNPSSPAVLYAATTNFPLTVTGTVRASITVTVPAGMTAAAVNVTGRVLAFNPNTTGGAGSGTDYLYAQVNVGAFSGYGLPLVVTGSGSSDINSAPFSTVLPNLTPGSTFVVSLSAGTSFLTWAANVNNMAEIAGNITWYR
jgi:hypothetical protein